MNKKFQKNIIIKSAHAEDAEEICNLLIRSISEVCGPDYGNDDAILKEWLQNKTPKNIAQWINSNNYSYTTFHGGKIIGFSLMDTKGNLLLNYLLPEYLHQGIGKSLLEKIEQCAIENGINTIKVRSTTTAKDFYMKNGFVRDGNSVKIGDYAVELPLVKNLLEKA